MARERLHHPLFVMEKRHADGSLDLSAPQPPFLVCTENQIFDHYFRANPGPDSATQEAVREWYRAQGFVWRRKTW